MLTFNLSHTESLNYRGAVRVALKSNAAKRAYVAGKRFAQIVDSSGRIVDVIEVGCDR